MLFGYNLLCEDGCQPHNLDVRALEDAGCSAIFQDSACANRRHRPELERMLDQLGRKDTVVVWKLDRLAHSLIDLLQILEQISYAGARFRSITEKLDTTTRAGPVIIQLVKTLADFERSTIRRRTAIGLAAAHAGKKRCGRPKKIDDASRRSIAENIASGQKSGLEMARLYAVSPALITRIMAEYRASHVASS